VNETECASIADADGVAGGSPEEQAVALARRRGLVVVVTLGEGGVLAVNGGRLERAAALPVRPVDTVGAGDSFCGYLAAGLSQGMPLAKALTLGAAAGSLACTKSGAQPAIPLRGEVDGALDRSPK
jgi:ribokinase